MLDSSGEVLDVLYAGSLTNSGQSVYDKNRKKNDQKRVFKFMTDHQPHVVVLGAVNLSCARLKEDIYEVYSQNVYRHVYFSFYISIIEINHSEECPCKFCLVSL